MAGTTGRSPLSGNWLPCGQLGSGGPSALALSADGQTLAASFDRGPVLVYRVADHQVIQRFGLDAPPYATVWAISPNGNWLATHAGTLKVWRVADGALLLNVPGSSQGAAFAPDGDQLLVLSYDLNDGQTAEVWSVSMAKVLRAAGAADIAAFASAGAQVITHTHQDRQVRVTGGGATPAPITLTLDESLAHAISPQGTMIVGYRHPSDLPSTTLMEAFRLPDGHRSWSVSVDFVGSLLTFSPDEHVVVAHQSATLSLDSAFEAFDARTGASASLAGLPDTTRLRGFALGADARPTVIAADEGVFELTPDPLAMNLPSTPFPTPSGQGNPLLSVAVSSDGRWLATGSLVSDRSLIVWDLPARTELAAIPSHRSSTVTFSADARQVARVWDSIDAWQLDGGNAMVWRAAPPANIPASGGIRWFLAAAPRGPGFATNWGTSVALFDPQSPNTYSVMFETGRPYSAMAFSPDGATVATSGPALWRVSDGARLWPPGSSIAPPTGGADETPADNWIAFSPDGRSILVSEFVSGSGWLSDYRSYRTTTKLYRASDGALVRDLGNDLARRPAFSRDGAWIVAGWKIYPVEGGAPISLPPPHDFDSVSTFAPDGTIAIAGTDGITRLHCPE